MIVSVGHTDGFRRREVATQTSVDIPYFVNTKNLDCGDEIVLYRAAKAKEPATAKANKRELELSVHDAHMPKAQRTGGA